MRYTIDNLDSVISRALNNPDLLDSINRPAALRMAIVEVFLNWKDWENHPSVNILREAENDLRTKGQFDFSEEKE